MSVAHVGVDRVLEEFGIPAEHIAFVGRVGVVEEKDKEGRLTRDSMARLEKELKGEQEKATWVMEEQLQQVLQQEEEACSNGVWIQPLLLHLASHLEQLLHLSLYFLAVLLGAHRQEVGESVYQQ